MKKIEKRKKNNLVRLYTDEGCKSRFLCDLKIGCGVTC